jgi:hypothetical protein
MAHESFGNDVATTDFRGDVAHFGFKFADHFVPEWRRRCRVYAGVLGTEVVEGFYDAPIGTLLGARRHLLRLRGR